MDDYKCYDKTMTFSFEEKPDTQEKETDAFQRDNVSSVDALRNTIPVPEVDTEPDAMDGSMADRKRPDTMLASQEGVLLHEAWDEQVTHDAADTTTTSEGVAINRAWDDVEAKTRQNHKETDEIKPSTGEQNTHETVSTGDVKDVSESDSGKRTRRGGRGGHADEIPHAETDVPTASQVESVEATSSPERQALRASHKAFYNAKKAYFSDEFLSKTKELKSLEQALKKVRGESVQTQSEMQHRREELAKYVSDTTTAYAAAKQPYASALKNYISQKAIEATTELPTEIEVATQEQMINQRVSAMVGARFFASSRAERYQTQNKTAEVSGQYCSYREQELVRKEELLSLERKNILGRMREKLNIANMNTSQKIAFGAAVMTGTLASAALTGPRSFLAGLGAGIAVRQGTKWAGMKLVNAEGRTATARNEAISTFDGENLATMEAALDATYDRVKRDEKIVSYTATGLGMAAGYGTRSWLHGTGIDDPLQSVVKEKVNALIAHMQLVGKAHAAVPPIDTLPPTISHPESTYIGMELNPDIVGTIPEVENAAPRPAMPVDAITPDMSPAGNIEPPATIDTNAIPAELESIDIEKYTVQAGDNFWDIAEGQTNASQPSVFLDVPPEKLQALIDLTRDRIESDDVLARSIGFTHTGSADLLNPGDTLDLQKIDAVARSIATEHGWIDSVSVSPDTVSEVTPLARPENLGVVPEDTSSFDAETVYIPGEPVLPVDEAVTAPNATESEPFTVSPDSVFNAAPVPVEELMRDVEIPSELWQSITPENQLKVEGRVSDFITYGDSMSLDGDVAVAPNIEFVQQLFEREAQYELLLQQLAAVSNEPHDYVQNILRLDTDGLQTELQHIAEEHRDPFAQVLSWVQASQAYDTMPETERNDVAAAAFLRDGIERGVLRYDPATQQIQNGTEVFFTEINSTTDGE